MQIALHISFGGKYKYQLLIHNDRNIICLIVNAISRLVSVTIVLLAPPNFNVIYIFDKHHTNDKRKQ